MQEIDLNQQHRQSVVVVFYLDWVWDNLVIEQVQVHLSWDWQEEALQQAVGVEKVATCNWLSKQAIATLLSTDFSNSNFLEVASNVLQITTNSLEVAATRVEKSDDWAKHLKGYSNDVVDILHNWVDMGAAIN